MELIQLLVLALVQGITEFLPISSSAHLVLVPVLGGWEDQGTQVDVATHLGTLLAVLIYFRRDGVRMAAEALRSSGGGEGEGLLLKIAVATVPVVVAGLLLRDLVGTELRSVAVVAWTTLGFGLLLYWADRRHGERELRAMSLGDAAVVGLSQMLALIPGVSRAGITMTAARFLGYSRAESARFSLLLSVPTILAASGLIGFELYRAGMLELTFDLLSAAGLAFLAALLAISGMMSWLRSASFTPFVIYRVLLGVGLLVWVYA